MLDIIGIKAVGKPPVSLQNLFVIGRREEYTHTPSHEPAHVWHSYRRYESLLEKSIIAFMLPRRLER